MVTILYKDCLCLATASRADQVYTIQACIGLNDIKVEEVDNGRGKFTISIYRSPGKLTNWRPSMSHGSLLVEARLRMRPSTLRNCYDSLFSKGGNGMAQSSVAGWFRSIIRIIRTYIL